MRACWQSPLRGAGVRRLPAAARLRALRPWPRAPPAPRPRAVAPADSAGPWHHAPAPFRVRRGPCIAHRCPASTPARCLRACSSSARRACCCLRSRSSASPAIGDLLLQRIDPLQLGRERADALAPGRAAGSPGTSRHARHRRHGPGPASPSAAHRCLPLAPRAADAPVRWRLPSISAMPLARSTCSCCKAALSRWKLTSASRKRALHACRPVRPPGATCDWRRRAGLRAFAAPPPPLSIRCARPAGALGVMRILHGLCLRSGQRQRHERERRHAAMTRRITSATAGCGRSSAVVAAGQAGPAGSARRRAARRPRAVAHGVRRHTPAAPARPCARCAAGR